MTVELEGDGGSLVVSTHAIAQIVAHAAESVDGVRVRKPRRRIDVAVEGGLAHVSLTFSLAYGRAIAEAGREVQERVASALTTMCGCTITAVDVTVEELDE